ncbi:penicillin-binding protein 1A [Polaromonas eurypsychrophila]|uniref:Penicillin-binding protein 1A n=1 Tax=Polaromonas eurypsychrophila TaxID=1614635 RepID=A0A916WM70_9BURK|nr:transglycosylase domain-containing protein [Polaromonas eurypsychrophila]GGB11416.1 penicillin-binding protein 1A [Polaromonas eurypsychrophila]
MITPPDIDLTEPAPSRLRQIVTSIAHGLRHPTLRGLAWGLAAVPVVLLIYVLALIPFTPSINDLRKAKAAKPSVVLSADGQQLTVFSRANRDWVPLAEISPHVVNALISTEDARFYQHRGMHLQRTASAAMNTVQGKVQGGSTITQQLARNLYPEEIGRARTMTRKIKEAITSLKIEAVYSKDEILETYLNTVPFLYNAYGIEMAARTYFDKTADTLNVLESATLIGMLKGTSYYNPVLNPERALQRRNTVLGRMVRHQKLPAEQLAALKQMPLKVDFERQEPELGPAPHFTQQLRRWLIEWADRNSYNMYADGLVVHTTIDSRLQVMANEALTRQADKLQTLSDADWAQKSGWTAKGAKRELMLTFVRDSAEYKAAIKAGQSDEQSFKELAGDVTFMQKLREDKTRLQAGFLALNPSNGHVMAWVGSRDFVIDQFDHVAQARRQPGSTFKPFVYGAALENGSRPYDGFMDQAVDIAMGDGSFWRPSDGGGPSGAPMTLREGLVYSKNTITAQVMQIVGPARVASLARSMGVRQSKLDEVMSLALGTSPVTLREMVASYGTLVNDGRYVPPMVVTRVEDRNGQVVEAFQSAVAETAMSTAAANMLLDVMRGVVDQGTGAGIRSRYGIKADVAGKTGTTQDNTDGWFILMHPQLVAGAWVGFNDNRVTMGDRWGQGAQSALPMVGEFFQQAIKAKVVDARARFSAPDGLSKQAPPPGLEPLPLPGAPLAEITPIEPPLGSAVTVQGPQGGAPTGMLSPPPIKYVNIQILPAAPAPAADLPAMQSPPPRAVEAGTQDAPRELPVLQMSAPRVVTEP